MGTANVKGMEFIVTIELAPEIYEDGLSRLKVAKMKVGAMNITPLAKLIARRMYAEQVGSAAVDEDAWQTKITASLLNDQLFEPLFSFRTEDAKIRLRVEKIAIDKGKLSFRLIPIL